MKNPEAIAAAAPWSIAALTVFSSPRASTQHRMLAEIWGTGALPASLLRHDGYAEVEGSKLLAVSTFNDFSRPPAPTRDDVEVTWLRHRRSVNGGLRGPVGCLVVVDAPAPGGASAAAWIDEHARDGGDPMPGFIAAHFHVADGGERIVNLAEWESIDAHLAWSGLERAGGHPVIRWYEPVPFED